MKLNHDCVRDVLLFVEEEQRPGKCVYYIDFKYCKQCIRKLYSKVYPQTLSSMPSTKA